MEDRTDRGRFEDLGRALDCEIQKLIDFVNDRVVPAARQDSEVVLRKAAQKLEQLADRLASERGAASAPPGPEEKKPEGQ
jgi:hypothetical protein